VGKNAIFWAVEWDDTNKYQSHLGKYTLFFSIPCSCLQKIEGELGGEIADKKEQNMPILPENKGRYPSDWKAIRARILEEYQNKCEFCGVENHTVRGARK
jgi:hypothetical protein